MKYSTVLFLNLVCVASTCSLNASSSYESIQLGDFSLGGAMRVNYIQDSSQESDTQNASKGSSQGVFDLDTVRVNVDYKHDAFLGKFEYRWYPGFGENGTNYSFIHTLWLGYALDDTTHIEVGINRVPFGPSAYGVSQSWFCDQHYYVGLSDDMDLGAKISGVYGESLKYDVGYYPMSEPEGVGVGGASGESARYAYDVVGDFHERNQVAARLIYTAELAGITNDFGVSLLYSQLEAQNSGVADGTRFAASAHMINHIGNFTLATQLTRYEMSVDNDGKDDSLINMGGFNYGEGVSAKAWLPAISANYKLETPEIEWLDYALPYIEYSNIIKDESSFNNSYMYVIGSAFARGNWYIYTDLALANGNYFVGPLISSDGDTNNFGANTGNELEHRINVNLGYYF